MAIPYRQFPAPQRKASILNIAPVTTTTQTITAKANIANGQSPRAIFWKQPTVMVIR